jgi:UDP-N-acetylmuramate--alanine ligase
VAKIWKLLVNSIKRHYYFIGIGGIGMSGLAHILLKRGYRISGSDPVSNKQTADLISLGATIYTEQKAEHICDDIDVVVTTSAIGKDNPEVKAANTKGLQVISRSVLLNEILSEHKAIAVTGTHGKTTTSSMMALALTEAGLDPTAILGAEVHTIQGNAKEGKGEYTVAEVCEYERAFLDIYPYGAVITNIEADHLDCYLDIHDIIDAFSEFVTHMKQDGFLVYMGDDNNCQKVAKRAVCPTYSYGLTPDNQYRAQNIVTTDHHTVFDVYKGGKSLTTCTLGIPGNHNLLDALAVIAVADIIGADMERVVLALSKFTGANRRFQIKAEVAGITIIDDYAHHPTEIAATLAGARQFYPNSRIIAVFQPHQHSRTKLLLNDFSNSFDNADIVYMPEIYAVRDTEEDIQAVSSKNVVELINKKVPDKAKYFENFDTCLDEIQNLATSGDIIITIGAGPVYKIGDDLSTYYTQSTS